MSLYFTLSVTEKKKVYVSACLRVKESIVSDNCFYWVWGSIFYTGVTV